MPDRAAPGQPRLPLLPSRPHKAKKSRALQPRRPFRRTLGVMDPKRQSDLDWMLARGRLSGPALERVLERAVSRAHPARGIVRQLSWFAPALAAGVALFVFRPW